MWKLEEALSVEERRKRYRVGTKYTEIDGIIPWTVQIVSRGWPSAHKAGVKIALPVCDFCWSNGSAK
jgi:hypothetical protein